MLSKWLASLLLLVAHVAVGLCDEEEYDLLLPVGALLSWDRNLSAWVCS